MKNNQASIPEKKYVYKDASNRWVTGFLSREDAIKAAISNGLTQFETASVSTESPAYFVRFLASDALTRMIKGMEDGELSGHVVNSESARIALQKTASANITDGFLDDSEDDSEWRLVVDLMNRLQDAAEAWFVENERSSIVLGYIDYGSTQLHISGTSLNVPLL